MGLSHQAPIATYAVALLVSFAVLGFLKFCEGTPFRTWKAVLLTGLALGLGSGYYFKHAFPPKPAPLPQVQKASAYRAELERTWRHIPGVDGISIVGTTVRVDLVAFKPLPEVKSLAQQLAGNAAFFLRTNGRPVRVKVQVAQRGAARYELDYEPGKGVVDEQEF
jgi:hypothetical protein